jgi:V8-like Glu-specific endopeptidase
MAKKKAGRSASQGGVRRSVGTKPDRWAVYRKALPDPAADSLTLESFMVETNGGGSSEKVPGFDAFRAITAGFDTRRVAGPSMVFTRPDGGFFAQGDQPLSPMPRVAAFTAKPENVIGIDSRVRVTETSAIPWRCICHIEVEYEAGPVGFGTGFLIGRKSVLTAAHVIVDPAKRMKARRLRVMPGRNGNIAPYGYFVADFRDCIVADQWLKTGSSSDASAASDYAIITIPEEYKTDEEPTAQRLGYFGLKCFSDAEVAKRANMLLVNNAGYPYEADKPYGTLWYNAGRVRAVEKTYIEYMVDTEGGQSGSPIYYFDEQTKSRFVIAIHTTGDFVNRGLRITRDVFTTIKKWTGR